MPSGSVLFTYKHRVVALDPSEVVGDYPMRVDYDSWRSPPEVDKAFIDYRFVPAENVLSLWEPEADMAHAFLYRVPKKVLLQFAGDTPITVWDSIACGNCVRHSVSKAKEFLDGNVDGYKTVEEVYDASRRDIPLAYSMSWAVMVDAWIKNNPDSPHHTSFNPFNVG